MFKFKINDEVLEGPGGTKSITTSDEKRFYKMLNTDEAIEWVSLHPNTSAGQISKNWLRKKYYTDNPVEVMRTIKNSERVSRITHNLEDKIIGAVIGFVLGFLSGAA